MGRSECMKIYIRLIPPNIVVHYKIDNLFYRDGWVYLEIIRGIYGIPQAVIIANNLLAQRLGNHGY